MRKPRQKSDVGSYYATLIDSNYRALAAIAFGKPAVPVSRRRKNHRDDVRKEDFLKVRGRRR
jgi:hypothetical protein